MAARVHDVPFYNMPSFVLYQIDILHYLGLHRNVQNRQKDEIARDIMSVCNGGALVTKVMFHAYMTHGQVKLYLNELVEKDLVMHDPLTRRYTTTAKGMEYLATIGRMAELLPLETKRAVASDRLARAFL
jgi:predicted transcriptional regulator